MIIAVLIGNHRTGAQPRQLCIGIFKGIDIIVVIGADQGVGISRFPDDVGLLCKHRKVGGLIIIQIINTLGIIVIHGTAEQSLHIRCIHRRFKRLTQGRMIISIQQKRFCHKIALPDLRQGNTGFGFLRCNLLGSTGKQLGTILGIDGHHQHRFFQRFIGHNGSRPHDLQIRHTVTGLLLLLCRSHRLGQFLTNQLAKTIGAFHRQLAVVHCRFRFLRLGEHRQHPGEHHRDQQDSYYSFRHVSHFLFWMLL